MTTVETTTAAGATAPAKPRASRAVAAGRQIAVRPIAAGLANTAAIGASSLYYAAGAAGLAVAAGGAAAAAAVGAASSRRTSRRAAGASSRRSGAAGSATSGRAGRATGTAARTGAAPRGTAGTRSGSSPGGASANKRSAVGRGAAPGTSAGGRGRAGGAAGSGFRRTGFRRTGSTAGSGRRSPLTAARVAAGRRRVAAQRARALRQQGRQAGPRMSDAIRAGTAPTTSGQRPTAGQAWRTARKAITGSHPKRRGPVQIAVAGWVAGAVAADKAQRERWRARRKAAAARTAKNTRARGKTKPGVNGTVRRPDTTNPTAAGQQKKSPPAPTGQPQPLPGATHPNPTGGTPMSRHLRDLSEDFRTAAAREQPEGMLQVVADGHAFPEVLGNHAAAMKIRYERARGFPLHPAIKDMYQAVHAASLAVVDAAAEIGPAIEKLHAEELNRLRLPRANEGMWDVRANLDTA